MGELMATINGRTPEEIRKGLECCTDVCDDGCDVCVYDSQYNRRDKLCLVRLKIDALAYIHQLERERDAAVETLKSDGACEYCKHNHICTKRFPYCPECERTDCICYTCEDRSNWQWRGEPLEVQHGTD